MKIAFTAKGTTLDSKIDERFGRAEYFVILDEDSGNLEVIENDTSSMEHGAGLQAVKKIVDSGVNVVITGNGAGQKVLDVLKMSDIEFFIGASGTLKEAYEAYKNGKLNKQF